jgi:hypothetical protein
MAHLSTAGDTFGLAAKTYLAVRLRNRQISFILALYTELFYLFKAALRHDRGKYSKII